MSEILYILDFSTFIFGIIGLMVTVLTGVLTKKAGFRMNRALQISLLSVIIMLFGFMNIVSIIDFSRLIIISFILSSLIPLFISFIMVWTNINDSSMTRIQVVSFVSWWIVLLSTGSLRLLLGWGQFESVASQAAIAILFTIVTGIISGVIGNIIIIQVEKIQTST